MRSDLPTGTVTFVFTDVQGSTRLLTELGDDAYASAIAEHHRRCRAVWAAFGGTEVDTAGDAFFVAFPHARAALGAVEAVHAALADSPIRIRVGVHTGDVTLAETGYVGVEVHRAARIAALGHGGQTLVSATTAALVAGSELQELGRFRLKDFPTPQPIFQLGSGTFPPLKTRAIADLPVAATRFLGRSRELRELEALVTADGVRITTVVGPGGAGKTRLALTIGQLLADRRDPVWVPLAAIRDPALVAPAVAYAVGAAVDPTGVQVAALAETLGERPTLLIMDNAEHLLDVVAELVTAVVTSTSACSVLVTSRERLRIPGEHVYRIPALDPEEAVALFLDRGRAVDPTLASDGVIERLCVRLDGLPLAIELAAARCGAFTPTQLLERIGRRLDVLKGGRGTDPRQQTLRATIAWSHDLLDAEQRRVLRGLSAFAGGATLEAAESVVHADADTIEELVDKSLVVRRVGTDHRVRYAMLETVREFAVDERETAGESDGLMAALTAHVVELLKPLSIAVRTHEDAATALVREEAENIRAALRWSLDHGDVVSGAWIFETMYSVWIRTGLAEGLAAGRQWLQLDRASAPVEMRAVGLTTVGELLRFAGDVDAAAAAKHEAIALMEATPHFAVTEWSRDSLLAATLTDMAGLELARGDPVAARRYGEAALAIRRRAGKPLGIGHALTTMAILEDDEGDLAAARATVEEVQRLSVVGDDPGDHLCREAWLAEMAIDAGDEPEVRRRLATIAPTFTTIDNLLVTIAVLRLLARVAVRVGEHELAGRLIGRIRRAESELGSDGVESRADRRRIDTAVAAVREALGDAGFRAACADGQSSDPRALGDETLAAIGLAAGDAPSV